MAQPTQYTRQYNFNDFQTTSPADPLPGVQIDNELNAAKTNLDGLNTNIAKIQRDDGLLANQSVHKNSFDVDALALIGLSGYTVSGNWSAGNSYTAGTLVNFNAATYLATVAHTSGTVFSTDLNAGKWILLANAAIDTSASAVDKFEGTGSQTVFTLTFSYTSNTDVLVFVNGALRNPGDDYQISGNQITFSTAPSTPSVSGNENVIIWGPNVTTQSAVTSANTAASNASGFATAASNSATAAASSASSASTSAATATTQAATSTTQATASSTSAAAALVSQNAASASQSAAATSASNAAASESSASTSAATATTQAGISTTQAAASAASATTASGHADTSQNFAIKVDGAVVSSNYSAKAWAIGGTGVTDTAGSGSAKEWATDTTNTCDGTEFSAKEYAVGTQSAQTAGSAKQWAIGGGNSFSTNTAVSGGLFSAKYYAEQAAASKADFDNKYLGPQSSNPTQDPDGSALEAGDLYFNTTSNVLRVYNGSAWNDAVTDTTGFATNGFAIAVSIAL